MPIKSYLAYPIAGQRDELAAELAALEGCEAFPAENRDIIVLVTDTPDERSEQRLAETLNAIPSLQHLALVAGLPDDELYQIQTAEKKPE
jgi:nitrate reductase NapAB chaperone NapD